jgi:hypothetical protein
MLANTFCHIAGISAKTEARLWSSGIITWDAALSPKALMVQACNLKLAKTPFADTHMLAQPFPPASPFQADREAVERAVNYACGVKLAGGQICLIRRSVVGRKPAFVTGASRP